jgi:hypothetical protein
LHPLSSDWNCDSACELPPQAPSPPEEPCWVPPEQLLLLILFSYLKWNACIGSYALANPATRIPQRHR